LFAGSPLSRGRADESSGSISTTLALEPDFHFQALGIGRLPQLGKTPFFARSLGGQGAGAGIENVIRLRAVPIRASSQASIDANPSSNKILRRSRMPSCDFFDGSKAPLFKRWKISSG
jgi:hypothetical protein